MNVKRLTEKQMKTLLKSTFPTVKISEEHWALNYQSDDVIQCNLSAWLNLFLVVQSVTFLFGRGPASSRRLRHIASTFSENVNRKTAKNSIKKSFSN